MEVRIRQRLNFELTEDTAVVTRVLRVDDRFYVQVETSQVTSSSTLMAAVNDALDHYLGEDDDGEERSRD